MSFCFATFHSGGAIHSSKSGNVPPNISISSPGTEMYKLLIVL